MPAYDVLIVGAGLFGAVFAREALDQGKRVLVLEKRNHIGGNIYTEDVGGIPVHRYGAHIFHTDDEAVWAYVNRFVRFNRYTNSPLARYGNELYNLPFNMNTFSRMWGISTPQEAQAIIARQRAEIKGEPQNLEEQAISLVGRDVYEKLVKGYTEKQWGRPCSALPPFIIKRLPVRFVYDNNYFNDRYQGVPEGGYTLLAEKLLDGADVRLNTLYTPEKHRGLAELLVYTGPIDAYFGFCLGPLGYRSLRFETQDLTDTGNYQGNAVINYTEAAVPYTRIIEHKHFAYDQPEVMNQPHTVVTREYPQDWQVGDEPYYPVNDEPNSALFRQYQQMAQNEQNVLFGGRLGQYRYFDMDDTVRAALDQARQWLAAGSCGA